ncbi:hypothetical protein [Streptomyces sp. NPDC020489]|uniref:hypothetical protein n=1 Tax=Streptomyces sp. NPDC020489 TaxID=3365077 RepID=UPI00378A0354
MNGQGADELRIASLLRTRGIGPDATPQPQPDASTVVKAAAAAATAHTASAQPQPTAADEDWWDALYPDQSTPADTQPDTDPAGEGAGARAPRMRIPPWWSGDHIDTSPPATDAEDEDRESDEDQDDEPDDLDDGEDGEDLEEDAQPRTPDAAAPNRPAPKPRSRPGAKRSRLTPGKRKQPAPRALVDTPATPRLSLLDAAAATPPRIRWLILHASAAAAGYALGWVDWSTRTSAWIDEHGWLNPSAIFWCLLAVGCEALRHRARHTRLPIRWAAAVPIASIVAGAALYGVAWQTLDLGV